MGGTGAAIGHHHQTARVVAPFQRRLADQIGHLAVDHLPDAGCRGEHVAAEQRLGDVFPDCLGGGVGMQRHAAVEETLRRQIAQHQIGIGHGGRRAAEAVAGRPGIGAGAVRPHMQARAVAPGDGAAAGADGGDIYHGQAQLVLVEHGLARVRPLSAGNERHLEGGAAHVGGDGVGNAQLARQVRRAHHARRRAGLDGHDRHRLRNGRDATIGMHDQRLGLQPAIGQRCLQATQIVARDFAHIGVEQGRGAALVFTDDRRHMGRQRHIAAGQRLADDLRRAPLMGGILVRKQEGHRHRLVAARLQRRRHPAYAILVQRRDHAAGAIHALDDLEDVALVR